MADHWIDQEIVSLKSLRSQSWQAKNYIAHLQAEQKTLDAALLNPEQTLKHDKTTSVSLIRARSKRLVLKRYNPRTHSHKIKRAFRQSRARRCWQMSYVFARAGLNVAPPVLMLESRYGPVRSDAYFANVYLEGYELLDALPKMAPSEQQVVAKAIIKSFDQMHKYKITHGDMKASNLLWVNGKLFFIDLDAAKQHQTSWSWSMAHKKDRKRFIKNWLDYPDILSLFKEL